MSLQTIVQGGLAARLHRRHDVAVQAPIAARTLPLSTRASMSSMRALETALAIGAIAAALLIGQGQ